MRNTKEFSNAKAMVRRAVRQAMAALIKQTKRNKRAKPELKAARWAIKTAKLARRALVERRRAAKLLKRTA